MSAYSSSEEDLSDVDDDEISGCLNHEREVELKAKVWELMHGRSLKRKKPELENLPPDAVKKKAKSATLTSVKTVVAEDEKKRKARVAPLSSKINLEALNKLLGEEDADSEHNDKTENGGKGEESENLVEEEEEEHVHEDEDPYYNVDGEYESDRQSEYCDDY